MKIMTFNTQSCHNFYTRVIDFEIMAKTIRDYDPDIVGLNEMRGKGEHEGFAAQVEKLSELTGMKYFYFAKAIDIKNRGPYGNAFLSKIPIVSVETIMIPDPNPRAYNGYYETRCLMKATLENGVTVMVSHFGLNLDEHENAVKTVLENAAEKKCVLMGDFNLTPDAPVLAPIQNALCDTALAVGKPQFTFPSDKPVKRIDYIFVSKDVKVLDADVINVVSSDHRPAVATVEI